MIPKRHFRAATVLGAAAFTVVCWAYAPIGIHLALRSYGPLELALLRFIVASVTLAILAVARGRVAPMAWRDLGWMLQLACFGVVVHHIALNMGQRGVTAGAASSLAQSTPVFTALLAARFGAEALTRRHGIALALGALGAVSVVTGGGELHGAWLGGIALVGAAFSWAVYFTLLRAHAWRLDGLSCTCYTVWFGTLLLFPLVGGGWLDQFRHAQADANVALLVLGMFPSGLAYLSWNHVLRHVPAGRASMALYLVPPAAMALAIPLLGEYPSPGVIVGTICILVSVAWVAPLGAHGPTRRAPSHRAQPTGMGARDDAADRQRSGEAGRTKG